MCGQGNKNKVKQLLAKDKNKLYMYSLFLSFSIDCLFFCKNVSWFIPIKYA